MKSFRNFITNNEIENSGVAPRIIHFKFGKKKKQSYVKEDTSSNRSYRGWMREPSNTHLGPGPHPVSVELSKTNNYTPKEEAAIEGYTGHNDSEKPDYAEDPYGTYRPDDDGGSEPQDWHSYKINKALIENRPIPEHLRDTEAGLSSAIRNNPIPRDVDVFSGVSFDPRKQTNKDGIMTSPAYISASHDKFITSEYVNPIDGVNSHIMQIHLKAGDPATHVESTTLKPDEFETIIHKGVKLRHMGTETLNDDTGGYPGQYSWNQKPQFVHIHHFAVER